MSKYLRVYGEEAGINIKNEYSLHSSIKSWYAMPGDRFEAKVDGYIIDMVRDYLLIEIQTGNFAGIRKKLKTLTKSHPLLLLYPIPVEKWIVYVNESGEELLGRRKSPKRGKPKDVFGELVSIPEMISNENLTLVLLMTKEEEVRCRDGRGSWRRKGVSIRDRRLLEIIETIEFHKPSDFLRFLPKYLDEPFTNKTLAREGRISVYEARRMTYCMKKMGCVEVVGKKGNAQLFKTLC